MDGNVEINETLQSLKGKIVSIPVVDASLTKEGYAADAKTTGDALTARVKKADIVDNLISDLTDAPLSAKQGKVLKELLDDMGVSGAGGVDYDNAESGLEANNMQSAIDELASIANNAVSRSGGNMIRGPVNVQNADNGFGTLKKDNTSSEDNGTQIIDTDKSGNTAHVDVSAVKDSFTFTGKDGVERTVLHDGNKPFDSYTGNGSAGTRKISTGGVGRLLMVYCSTHISFVTPKGAIVVDLSDGGISWIDNGKVNYLSGDYTTETANAAFNASGITYYLQVI